MPEHKKIGGGLRPRPIGQKNFSLSTVFGSLAKDEIPSFDFDIMPDGPLKDQKDLDFCHAFAAAAASGVQDDQAFSPYYQAAKISLLKGNFHTWGADMQTALASTTKFGSCPDAFCPYSYPEQTRDFLADWRNYPDNLDILAKPYQKQSYFDVDGPYDIFDNIRAALWKHRPYARLAIAGCIWHDEWTSAPGGMIPAQASPGGNGHMFLFKGQRQFPGESEPRLKAQLSSGAEIGDRGYFYFTRAVVNREFAPFGQMMLVDMPREMAQYYHEQGISIQDNVLVKWLKIIRNLFSNAKPAF